MEDDLFDDRCDICRKLVGPNDDTKSVSAYWGHKACIEKFEEGK
jgi:hypothetical protein